MSPYAGESSLKLTPIIFHALNIAEEQFFFAQSPVLARLYPTRRFFIRSIATQKTTEVQLKMANPNLWNEGDNVLLRGVYSGRPTYVQSVRVVKDSPEETALLIWPGAECAAPSGYIQNGHNGNWNRWHETLSNTLQMKKYLWHTSRFLILLEPEKFYSTIYIWDAASNKFVCYYINFQLPYRRTLLGFDTLDLDLDIVIEASFEWEWKDVEEYQHAIRAGGIQSDWVKEIEHAKKEVFTRLEKRLYPLNSSWLNWRPNPKWTVPCLPENWEVVD